MAVASIDQVTRSVEQGLGCSVAAVRRQTRWRPCWFVDAERNGERLELVVRGERVDTCVQPLTKEYAFHRLLERHGLPVPKLYAWLDDIEAIVMERVPGQPDFAGTAEAERDTIVDEYLQSLARLHALDIAPFAEAGLLRAPSPEGSGELMHYELERLWRLRKRHPSPFLEFCLGWLHRHPPRSQGRESAIVWDSGQFHHHGGHLATVLDLEFGHLGDPMADLAVWRMRDTLIPFGDFRALYRRYEDLTGKPVDLEALKRHHFAATLSNELIFGAAILDPVPATDLMNNMQWTSETSLHATEALAEYLDIELPTIEPPEPKRRRTASTFAHLTEALRNIDPGDGFARHEARLAFRTVRYLARADQLGDAVVEAELDDIHRVLGKRPVSWWEGDEMLERFVLADAGEGRFDADLVWLFHRRNLRNHTQMGPPGSKMVAHYPTQRFDGRAPINTAQVAPGGTRP